MKNLKTLIFIFLFNLSHSFSSFLPSDNHLLNCGSAITITINNRKFIGDYISELRSVSLPITRTISASIHSQNPSPSSPPLYNTARVFKKPSNYIFNINKKGTHVVRLHFHPFQSDKLNLSNFVFHVSANDILLLKDFTPKPGNSIKEYLIWVDTDELVISFVPQQVSGFAFINAIEVFSAPDDLIADTAKEVSRNNVTDIIGLKHHALELAFRLNVGGPKVTPFNDSLWRTWIPDNGFFKMNQDSKAIHFGGLIKYKKGGLSREVGPDNIYNTARVVSNKTANMTWVFEVSTGYKYLVRMHFCDIASMILGQLYFNIYVNGYLALEDLDLSKITGVLASPYYVDFVVDADSLGLLNVSVGNSKGGRLGKVEAILNGLEIMKMSNSFGSLDGEVSADSILKSWPGGDGSILVPLVVMSLLIVGLAFVMRKRVLVKESAGWSPLRVEEN